MSPTLISTITDAVLDEVRAWQSRPLASVYPILYFDALFVKSRQEGPVQTKAVYLALGLTMDGEKELLGLWLSESGVAGIAALHAGATRVVAHNIDSVALAIAAKNAPANAVDLCLRGTPLLHGPCPARITCILVGDLFYERSEALALWAWLCTAHRRGVQVLVRTHSGRLPPRSACGVCGRNASPRPGPGRARMRGRCGSSPWTLETAPGERPCRMLQRRCGVLAHSCQALMADRSGDVSCTTMDPAILSTVPALPALSQSGQRDRAPGRQRPSMGKMTRMVLDPRAGCW